MSGRTYYNQEIVRWSYVALVCIALAFTSMTRAAASTKPGDYQSKVLAFPEGNACLVGSGVGEVLDTKICEIGPEFAKSEPMNSLFGSAFVNSGVKPHQGSSSRISPLHERQE